MLPSQFLNVVLEEFEGDVETTKTENSEPSFSKLKDLINSPLRQQLSVPVANITKPKKTNNNNDTFVNLEFPKKLPEAFLSECTVEICKRPIKKPLPKPKFEVLLLPVYSNKQNFRNHEKSQQKPFEGENDLNDVDETNCEVDALPEVEAVYSDHDTDSDEEIVFKDPPPSSYEPPPAQDDGAGPGKIHMCKFCHKIFPNKGVLWTHTTIAHADKLNCECPVCGRVFHRQCNLAVHLKSHEAEGIAIPESKLPDISNKSGTTLSTPADRPFKCPYCTKSYSQRSVLKKHMVVHTGERLTCNLCGIDFTQKSSLLRHVKRLHSADGSRPPYSRAPRKVPPLLNLRLTDHIKKVLANAPVPTSCPPHSSSPPSQTGQPSDPIAPQETASDDLSDGTRHSNNSEETEHSVDMPEQMANFIQSLKIPQGISISMIDD